MSICSELEEIRKLKGRSLGDLSRESGICFSTVCQALGRPHRNRRSNPRMATVEKLAQTLGVKFVAMDAELASRSLGE